MRKPEIYITYDFDENDGDYDYMATCDYLPTQHAVYLTAFGPDAKTALEQLTSGLIQLGFVGDEEEVEVVDETSSLEEA